MSDLPLEMLEAVLMRTFVMLYSSDYESDDDRHKSGKSVTAERRSFTVLSSVSWSWWKTLSGWPESPTGHWVRHQLRRLITSKCTVQTETICYKTTLTCLVVLIQITSVTDRQSIAKQTVQWSRQL